MSHRTNILSLLFLSLAVFGAGCASPPAALVKAPKLGLVGEPKYDVMDNSTNEYVSFKSSADESAIRTGFDGYCRRRGLTPGRPVTGITWYESGSEALGILISADRDSGISRVTYFEASHN